MADTESATKKKHVSFRMEKIILGKENKNDETESSVPISNNENRPVGILVNKNMNNCLKEVTYSHQEY